MHAVRATVHHLEELRASGTPVVPAVNQVEVNPYITRAELARYCREKVIVIEAYSPLAKAQRMDDPKLLAMAAKYNLTAAQVTPSNDVPRLPTSDCYPDGLIARLAHRCFSS